MKRIEILVVAKSVHAYRYQVCTCQLECKDNVDNYETTSIMETVDLQIVISHSRLLRCRKNDSAINYNLSSNTFMILYVKRKDIWGSLIKLKDSLLL